MARHFKSNSWAPRVSVSSGAINHGRTDEALTRTSLVPIPVLVVGFKSSGIAVTGARNAVRPPQVAAQSSPSPTEEGVSSGEPQTAPDNGSETVPPKERRAPAPGQGDSIELIIDKLP